MSFSCDICYTDKPSSQSFVHCTVCVNRQCIDCTSRIQRCPFCRTMLFNDTQFQEIQFVNAKLTEFLSSDTTDIASFKSICWFLVHFKDIFSLPIYSSLRQTFRSKIIENETNMPLSSFFIEKLQL